jgi:hypothetical protein
VLPPTLFVSLLLKNPDRLGRSFTHNEEIKRERETNYKRGVRLE